MNSNSAYFFKKLKKEKKRKTEKFKNILNFFSKNALSSEGKKQDYLPCSHTKKTKNSSFVDPTCM